MYHEKWENHQILRKKTPPGWKDKIYNLYNPKNIEQQKLYQV